MLIRGYFWRDGAVFGALFADAALASLLRSVARLALGIGQAAVFLGVFFGWRALRGRMQNGFTSVLWGYLVRWLMRASDLRNGAQRVLEFSTTRSKKRARACLRALLKTKTDPEYPTDIYDGHLVERDGKIFLRRFCGRGHGGVWSLY